MKCPLKQRERFYGSLPLPDIDDDCFKEECAWWDGHGGFCSVLKISRYLEAIGIDLERLTDKMPHAGPFTK